VRDDAIPESCGFVMQGPAVRVEQRRTIQNGQDVHPVPTRPLGQGVLGRATGAVAPVAPRPYQHASRGGISNPGATSQRSDATARPVCGRTSLAGLHGLSHWHVARGRQDMSGLGTECCRRPASEQPAPPGRMGWLRTYLDNRLALRSGDPAASTFHNPWHGA